MKVTIRISSFATACTVAFSQPNFVANENSGQASIEVVVCNPLPEEFNILINTTDGSATGELLYGFSHSPFNL